MNAPLPTKLASLATKADDQTTRLRIHEYQRLFSADTYNAELHETDREVMLAAIDHLIEAACRCRAELCSEDEANCAHRWAEEDGGRRCELCGLREGV